MLLSAAMTAQRRDSGRRRGACPRDRARIRHPLRRRQRHRLRHFPDDRRDGRRDSVGVAAPRRVGPRRPAGDCGRPHLRRDGRDVSALRRRVCLSQRGVRAADRIPLRVGRAVRRHQRRDRCRGGGVCRIPELLRPGADGRVVRGNRWPAIRGHRRDSDARRHQLRRRPQRQSRQRGDDGREGGGTRGAADHGADRVAGARRSSCRSCRRISRGRRRRSASR